MPHLMECTFTANQPLNRPTIIPLIDEPTRIPPINGRASGVNQAVAPSMAPRTSPKTNPTQILLMARAPRMRDIAPAFRVARDSFKGAAEKRAGTLRLHRLQRATARPHSGFQIGAFDAKEARSKPRLPTPPESARCLPEIRSPSDSVYQHPASSPSARSPAG